MYILYVYIMYILNYTAYYTNHLYFYVYFEMIESVSSV